MHEPPDALMAPRYTGPRTYARLPYTQSLDGVDCAIFGMPWDGGASFRPGTRFGPEGIRSASGMIRTFNHAHRVQVFGTGHGRALPGALSCIDYGDTPTVPGYIEETLRRIEAFVAPLAKARVVTFGMGGDHSVTLAELRALAKVHGPLGLVHLDSHTDLWQDYFDQPYSHGTMFRRAIEEGTLDPGRVFQAGMHGPLYVADDEGLPAELGTEMVPWLELCELTPAAFAERVRGRVGTGPTFLTFDVDLVDACFCPGTGTPEVGGPTPHQALQYVRALAGIPFVGFDVVEVSPPYDGPAQVTSLFAANLLFDLLALVARDRLARGDGAAAGARDRAQ